MKLPEFLSELVMGVWSEPVMQFPAERSGCAIRCFLPESAIP